MLTTPGTHPTHWPEAKDCAVLCHSLGCPLSQPTDVSCPASPSAPFVKPCCCHCCHYLLLGGTYSGAFVNEFKIFIEELRDFFNAAGLTKLLDNVKGGMGAEDQQVCCAVVVGVLCCAVPCCVV